MFVRVLLSALLLADAAAAAQGVSTATTFSPFETAFAHAYTAYQAKQFAVAEAELETLRRTHPGSFDVHELLGLVLAARQQDAAAAVEMRRAVELQPHTASARNNLATTLVRMKDTAGAEREWHAALAAEPADYSANRNLARLYLEQGKAAEAMPLLQAAHAVHPEALDNGYDLALAEMMTGQLGEAHADAETLLQQQDAGEFHTLLGQVDEKQGRYVEAAGEFSRAAHLQPSEENLFTWGSELMAHRAYEPAITVFRDAAKRYPESARLWVGAGMSLYSRGDYTEAVSALLRATDLDPKDARAYLFLSKAYLSSPTQAEEVIARFGRYAALQPDNAQAQFDYAVSLWKGCRVNSPEVDYPAVEQLFQRSLALDDRSAETHLQYGVLLNDEHKLPQAQAHFERAVTLDPALADAHFRLGRAYLRSGEKEKAQAELDRFKALQAEHQAEVDRERAAVQQFVIAGGDGAAHGLP